MFFKSVKRTFRYEKKINGYLTIIEAEKALTEKEIAQITKEMLTTIDSHKQCSEYASELHNYSLWAKPKVQHKKISLNNKTKICEVLVK